MAKKLDANYIDFELGKIEIEYLQAGIQNLHTRRIVAFQVSTTFLIALLAISINVDALYRPIIVMIAIGIMVVIGERYYRDIDELEDMRLRSHEAYMRLAKFRPKQPSQEHR